VRLGAHLTVAGAMARISAVDHVSRHAQEPITGTLYPQPPPPDEETKP
jgi:hypothetical protein